MTKYIFVTGGVVSGLGKGITAASLGRLLKARGLKVAAQKLDPYINVDPGTMSPYQHGEVYAFLHHAPSGGLAESQLCGLLRHLHSAGTEAAGAAAGDQYRSALPRQ